MAYTLKDVNNIDTMLRYCNDSLGWQIDEDYLDDIDELTYDFTAADLGIREEAFVKVNEFKQMRPITDNQEWAVFFVDFEGKHLDIAALRSILNAIIPKRSNRDRTTWACNHIFFMCLWGESEIRTIGFSAFEERGNSLPVMKIIYCTPSIESDDGISSFEKKISFLHCENHESFVDRLPLWTSVLRKRHQNIHSAKQLTEALANKAAEITDILSDQYTVENENGRIHKLFNRFNSSLNIEMTENEFMHMYAQTIVYGLFSARCMDASSKQFDIVKAADSIPKTNPLLKALMHELLDGDSVADFDELEISDLVDALQDADITSILEDFGRQTGYGNEDPLIVFYEQFLDLYEKERRKRCGAYYTPIVVANFMVRAVESLLTNELDFRDGLLDDKITVLDPAVGTGTFLGCCIDAAYKQFKKNQVDCDTLAVKWTEFVKDNLLQKLIGYEFMMSPYAMAHMKLAMKLKGTGYTFPEGYRLQIYLTNSLISETASTECEADLLKIENSLATTSRKSGKINVVIGSPPFHADSKNKNKWIMGLMEDYKKEPGTDERLQEKNAKLINDDYVKFIRLAEDIVSQLDDAVIAYMVPNSYASNITFRGMRWDLLKHFSEIYVLDLHGNVMGRDATGSSERDENIVDIQLGVSISFFIKKKSHDAALARVYYADLTGSRDTKYRYLMNTRFEDIEWREVVVAAPYYFFKPIDLSKLAEYRDGISLSELFPESLGGIKTHDDGNLVSFNAFDTPYDYLYDYRPFDVRHINYDRKKVGRDRYKIMRHMIDHDNYGLVIDRQVLTDNWSHIQIVRNMIDNRVHYSNRGIPVLCPMFLYDDSGTVMPNVNKDIVRDISQKIGMIFSESLTDDEGLYDMLDLYDYAYAVLNSPYYIERYLNLLKIEFPRVLVPASREMFTTLVSYGRKLRQLHMLEKEPENIQGINFEGSGDNVVTNGILKPQGLYINRTQYFSNVTEELWNFNFGGYRGLQRWFQDRKGMELSADDIQHVIKVFNVFAKTLSIRESLDAYLKKLRLDTSADYSTKAQFNIVPETPAIMAAESSRMYNTD